MKRLQLYVLCLICTLAIHTAFCVAEDTRDPHYVFYSASRLYEEGDYDEALFTYQQIVDKGLESGQLYFNMGNCYFKKGLLGKAILYYERARRLLPRDGDIASNYHYAKSLLKETINAYVSPWYMRLVRFLYKNLSIDELTIVLSALYGVLIFLGVLIIIFRRKEWYCVAVGCVCVILFVSGFFSLVENIHHSGHDAIVISKEASVKFEPFERATTRYTVYEGMDVTTIQTKGVWYKVKRADGIMGWIKSDSIEII